MTCFTVYPEPGYTVDKMYGVHRLLKRTGTEWSAVLAIGDSWNDLPKLRAARLSACPVRWADHQLMPYFLACRLSSASIGLRRP